MWEQLHVSVMMKLCLQSMKAFEGFSGLVVLGPLWSQRWPQRTEAAAGFRVGLGITIQQAGAWLGPSALSRGGLSGRTGEGHGARQLMKTKTFILHLLCLSQERNMFRCGFLQLFLAAVG